MTKSRDHVEDKERSFHDKWAAKIDVDNIDVKAYFECSTCPENRFILAQLGDLRGKRILDLGAGAGENSVYFALMGAKAVASDLSPGMLERAQALAKRYGTKIETVEASAFRLPFPDASFDIVYAANLLHHVDPEPVIAEMHRILVPGGKACFWDPLKHNLAINIYRRIASGVRTPDEMPLDFKIMKRVKSLFTEVKYDTFWFATLWIFVRFYFIERVDPNKERYWKKIVYEESRLRASYLRLEKFDRLLKRIPFLRRLAWNIAVVATK